jgi:hypothetical protein
MGDGKVIERYKVRGREVAVPGETIFQVIVNLREPLGVEARIKGNKKAQ